MQNPQWDQEEDEQDDDDDNDDDDDDEDEEEPTGQKHIQKLQYSKRWLIFHIMILFTRVVPVRKQPGALK